MLRRPSPEGPHPFYTKKPPAAKAVGAFLRSIPKRRERDTLTSFETAKPILPKLMLRRTLPEGPHPFTPKSPQPQRRWELSYEVFQNGERGILSLRSRLRCRSSRSLCSDEPSPEGPHPFYTKKPPAAKAVGAFLRSISKRRERDTLTSFETAMPILPKLMLRRTLPRGSSSLYTKKPPAAKAVGAFLRSISKRRERDSNPRTAYAV